METQTNRRTDGDQRIENTHALVPLPSGGALATFSSIASADSTEIRGAELGANGDTLGTCSADGEATWVAVDPQGPARQVHARPTLGRPWADGTAILLAYEATVGGSEELQVFVQPFDTQGCSAGPSVQISSEDAGVTAGWLQVVTTAPQEFVVIWSAAPLAVVSDSGPAIRARALRIGTELAIEYLPTINSRAGDTVDLVTNAAFETMGAGERGDGGVLFAWMERDLGGRRLHLTSFDEALRQTADTTVSESEGDSSPPDGIGLDVASAGDIALVTWVERDGVGTPRVFGRRYSSQQLVPQASSISPHAEKFRLGEGAATDEGFPSVEQALPDGFVVSWSESGDPSAADKSGMAVRTLLLGKEGAPEFANLACDARDFQLNVGTLRDQIRPNGAFLNNGTFVAVWTDSGRNGTDLNGDGVRAIALTPNLLRPTRP